MDQALSSLSNFALTFAVAHAVSTRRFGQFSLVLATYYVVLGCSRAVNTEPLVVRYSHRGPEEWRHATAKVTGAALGLGIATGAGCVLAGLFIGDGAGAALVALGVGLPGLLLQDSWRWAFIAVGRARLAAVNDAVWAMLLFPCLALYVGAGHSSVAVFVLMWGLAGWAAALYGAVQGRITPRPFATLTWWREERHLAPRYLCEFLALGGATQLSNYGVAMVAGLVAVGSLRAGWLLFGPFAVLLMGVRFLAVAEGVRVLQRSVDALRHTSLLIAAGLGTAGLACGAVLLALPDFVGRALLDSNWDAGRTVIVPLTVYTAASGVALGAAVGMRVLLVATESLRVRLVAGSLMVTGGLVGAALGQGYGAAWGMALANAIGAVLWWQQYTTAIGRYGRGAGVEADGAGCPAYSEGWTEATRR